MGFAKIEAPGRPAQGLWIIRDDISYLCGDDIPASAAWKKYTKTVTMPTSANKACDCNRQNKTGISH
jgi:hypothetical protein